MLLGGFDAPVRQAPGRCDLLPPPGPVTQAPGLRTPARAGRGPSASCKRPRLRVQGPVFA